MCTYVLMKILESSPKRYDVGMAILTLGRLRKLKERVSQLVSEGDWVLDIGCGTGDLAVMCARRGGSVIGIDTSSKMLEIARKRARDAGLDEKISLRKISALELDEEFEDESFDVVTCTLVLGEISGDERGFVLREIHRILKKEGIFAAADEVKPKRLIERLLFYLLRSPLTLITYLIAQTTIHPLPNLKEILEEVGFAVREEGKYLIGTLRLFVTEKAS